MFPLSSELPLEGIARTFLCLPIRRVRDIRVFASQLESLWWLLCSVENKMLCCCVRGRLCVCHHFVLDLRSSRSNPAPSCHFVSYKCTSPATTTTKNQTDAQIWCFCSVIGSVASLFPLVLFTSSTFLKTFPVCKALCRELGAHETECDPCLWAAHSLVWGDRHINNLISFVSFPRGLTTQTHHHPSP